MSLTVNMCDICPTRKCVIQPKWGPYSAITSQRITQATTGYDDVGLQSPLVH